MASDVGDKPNDLKLTTSQRPESISIGETHADIWDGSEKQSDKIILDEALDFSGIDEKKVLRKMDLRLIPILAVLYLLSFLDRGLKDPSHPCKRILGADFDR